MKKVVGYLRVSTIEQASEGLSLANQEAKIEAFATAKDWDLIGIFRDEGVSAKDLNREGIQQVIEGCRKHEFDVVIIYKLDRLTRSVRDLGYLTQDVFEKTGVDFSSIQDNFDTTTANGKLVLNILGSVAQWERDIIAERTREVLMYKALQSKRVGQIPYGWRLADDGDTLLEIEQEQAAISLMQHLRGRGHSLQAICNELTRQGYLPLGKRWYSMSVHNILNRLEKYKAQVGVMRKGRQNSHISDPPA